MSRRALVMAWVLATLLAVPVYALARERPAFAPAQWTFELKGGLWLPTGSVVQRFFSVCCNPTGMLEGGYLFRSRYGFDLGAGAFYATGSALGIESGAVSQDAFSLLLIPVTGDVTLRGRFWPHQVVVPFARLGPDLVFFRENDGGTIVKGVKWGGHGGGGVQFSLRELSGMEPDFEMNVRDVYIVTEGRYHWINNFGGGGLNLSGALVTLGFLVEF